MNEAPKRIEIPQFPQAKRLAVTTSWDDGTVYDRQVVACLNEWGIKGTFNLNSGLLMRTGKPAPADSTGHLDACEVRELYTGHEVAIHTLTHPHLPKLDPSQIAYEVLEDRRNLEDLVGYPVRGMAYPYGTYNREVIEILRALGIVYCRTVANADSPFPTDEPLAWPATCHHFSTSPLPVPERWQRFYEQPQEGRTFFIWAHSYEFPRQNRWADLESIYKPLSGKSDVWYCTNIELFDYEAARKRMVIAANRRSAYNPSGIPVSLRIDGKVVEVPPGATLQLG